MKISIYDLFSLRTRRLACRGGGDTCFHKTSQFPDKCLIFTFLNKTVRQYPTHWD